MSETEQPADLIDLQAQMNEAVTAADPEAVQRVFRDLVAQRAAFARQTEQYQLVLDKAFQFSDAHPEARKLRNLLQQHSALRDVANLAIARQREDGISVRRIFAFFGITFDEEAEEEVEEDTTSPLDEEAAIRAISGDQGHDYARVANVIGRTESGFARCHLALQYLEQQAENRSSLYCADFIAFVLREMYVLHPELKTRALPGKRQKQFEDRFDAALLELAGFADTATEPFVLACEVLNSTTLVSALLRDYARKNDVYDAFVPEDEPLRPGEDVQTRAPLHEALAAAAPSYAEQFYQKQPAEICTYLHQKLQATRQNTKEDDLCLAFSLVRTNQQAEAAQRLINLKDEEPTPMHFSVLVECALVCVKQFKLKQAAAFLSRVSLEGEFEDKCVASCFDGIDNLNGVCNLVNALHTLQVRPDHISSWEHDLLNLVGEKIMSGTESMVVECIRAVTRGSLEAVQFARKVSEWPPLGDLVERLVVEQGQW